MVGMETATTATAQVGDPRLFMSLPPLLRGLLVRCLRLPTASDALPPLLYRIVVNGQTVSVGLVGVYLVFVAAWLPFWLLSFLITEYGVYALAVATVFLVGRSIIRMIAFPGASRRVMADMETEFARYSVRMLLAATNSLVEVAAIVAPVDAAEAQRIARFGPDLAGLWHHAKMYRDRVLAVYWEVLLHLYQQQSQGESSHPTEPDLTQYGNNRMCGDIGDLSGLTPHARSDGHALLERLAKVLHLVKDLESTSRAVLEGSSPLSSLSDESKVIGKSLLACLTELRDFVGPLGPPPSNNNGGGNGDNDDNDPADSLRRRIDEESGGGTPLDTVKSGLNSIIPMLDPPPHTSIFGFDVQRGCMLSRYRGARQFWVRRPKGGMLDVLHFPARGFATKRNPKAVLYCNPNAGLIEVAAGMSLVGGNVPAADATSNAHESWIEFYTELGIDCYVYNYAGYGRSYGSTLCVSGKKADEVYHPGILARVSRIFRSCFLSFQPTSDTLRADGVAVGEHLVKDLGIRQLIIHGESIGGVAASGTGRYLSHHPATRNQLALLVCDRTFCNLEAVAQRLIGGWSGYAIRALAPLWNTDVTGDYLAASCPKVVAIDAADAMIADAASLKSGIALWKELHRGIGAAKGLGWMTEEPLQYRMADWENVCVNDSRYVASAKLIRAQAPVWPSDKHITVEEAFHFAACVKRCGKIAKQTARASAMGIDVDREGVLRVSQDAVTQAWTTLSCCDGLTGSSLGATVKRGFDATVAWLCNCLVFGTQTLVARAEKRLLQSGSLDSASSFELQVGDFDGRPQGYERLESATKMFPKPIPQVIETLVVIVEQGDETISRLSHELGFIIGMLQYVQSRLSATPTVETARKRRSLDYAAPSESPLSDEGSFLDLHCGHNNAFSPDEKERFTELLRLATTSRNLRSA